ncbi:MAG: hypothetical protein ABIZ91_20020 [Gemmatimonadaceae bacterium]
MSSTTTPINRALRIRSGKRFETWLGTFGGHILREAPGATWDTVAAGRRRSQSFVAALRAIADSVGNATVMAGYRGGSLVRLRTGRAGAVTIGGEPVSNFTTVARDFRVADGRSELFIAQVGVGLQRSTVQTAGRLPEPFDPYGDLVFPFARSGSGSGSIWAAARKGLFVLRNNRWIRDPSDSSPDTAAALLDGPVPRSGERGLIAGTWESPPRYRTSSGWHEFPGTPPEQPLAMALDTTASQPMLWVASRAGIHGFSYGSRQWTLLQPDTQLTRFQVHALATQRLESGQRVLWVATRGGGLGMALLGGNKVLWRWLAPKTSLVIPSPTLSGVVVSSDGLVHVSSLRGSSRCDPALPSPTRWRG